jgi:hypothetical protein
MHGGFWMLTRYEDVRAAFQAPEITDYWLDPDTGLVRYIGGQGKAPENAPLVYTPRRGPLA